jgi:hypothetical protein
MPITGSIQHVYLVFRDAYQKCSLVWRAHFATVRMIADKNGVTMNDVVLKLNEMVNRDDFHGKHLRSILQGYLKFSVQSRNPISGEEPLTVYVQVVP